MAALPCSAATYAGVMPSAFGAATFAPAFNSASAVSRSSACAIQSSAVAPSLPWLLTSAPCLTSIRTVGPSAAAAARTIGVSAAGLGFGDNNSAVSTPTHTRVTDPSLVLWPLDCHAADRGVSAKKPSICLVGYYAGSALSRSSSPTSRETALLGIGPSAAGAELTPSASNLRQEALRPASEKESFRRIDDEEAPCEL